MIIKYNNSSIGVIALNDSSNFGMSQDPILLHSAQCSGSESTLLQCNLDAGTSGDTHAMDAGVRCIIRGNDCVCVSVVKVFILIMLKHVYIHAEPAPSASSAPVAGATLALPVAVGVGVVLGIVLVTIAVVLIIVLVVLL